MRRKEVLSACEERFRSTGGRWLISVVEETNVWSISNLEALGWELYATHPGNKGIFLFFFKDVTVREET